MKTSTLSQFVCILTVAILGLIARTSYSFPFTDTFNYPLGNLATNLNSETNAWAPCGTNTTGLPDVVVTNITLTYPGLSCPATNSVYFTGVGYTERVAVAPPVLSTNTNTMAVSTNNFNMTSGTIYYSFVFVVSNLNGNSGNGGFMSGFNNTVGPQGTQPTIVGGRVYIRPSSLGITGPFGFFGYEIGIGKAPASPTNATWLTNQFVSQGGSFTPSTNLVVVSYTFLGGTSNDMSQMWLNPDPSTFGAASAPSNFLTNSIGNNIASIQTFMFRQGNSQVPNTLATDLRVGTNWSDVTVPLVTNSPAPTAAPLSVVASGGNAVISWTTNNSGGFRLQGTPTLILTSNAWTNVTAPTNVVGTNYTVSDPISGKNYYRLTYP